MHLNAIALKKEPIIHSMHTNKSHKIGTFLLRIALGAMFMTHSFLLKLFIFTLPGTAKYFALIGLPE